MKTGYSVSDAMSTQPVTVGPVVTVREAAAIMRERVVGSLLVVNSEHQLLGLLIAEDVVYRATAESLDPDLTPVTTIMTKELIDIRPEADIYEAMMVMREHDIYHLPVRDGNHKLIGFLTLKDILKIEPQLFDLMVEMAEIRPEVRAKGREGYCAECGNYAEDLEGLRGKFLCGYCRENA